MYQNKHLRLLLTVIIIMVALRVSAQVDPSLESLRNVVPPSPNASGLGRYSEWPVSLYTGIPNISIPIYEINGRGVKVPIDISYHASGNRVGDVASWVGLGWSLNSGGVITRSVRGLPDEDSYFTYANTYTNPNDFTSSPTIANFNEKHRVDAANQNGDSQQDLYMLNVMGRSYRLLLLAGSSPNTVTVNTIPYSNLKITYSMPNYWTVTMEDGTKILFGGSSSFVESNTITYGQQAGGITFPTTWYIQSITSPVGEVIHFTYTASTIIQDTHFTQSDWIQYETSSTGQGSCAALTNQGVSTHTQNQQVTQLSLATIESDLTRVYFIPSATARIDVQGGYALAEIKVFSKLANKPVDDYLFNTTNSQAALAAGNEYMNGGETDTMYFHHRLRLLSLKRQALDNSAYKLWSFSYNPLNLPSRRSYAQDHSGFYNGATSNTTLLPQVYFALPGSTLLPAGSQNSVGFTPTYSHPLGGYRGYNGAYMQAEMLTQITYPTGGYTQFNYEPNSMPVSTEQFTNGVSNNVLNVTPSQTNTTQSTTFTITKPQYVLLNFSSIISATIVADQSSTLTYAAILNSSGSTVAQFTSGAVVENGRSSSYSNNSYFNLLTAGTYTLKVWTNASAADFTNPGTDYVNMNAYVTYSQSLGIQNFNMMVGGLRIKSIINYDGVTTTPVNDRYFSYASPFLINPVDTANDNTNSYTTTQNNQTSTCSFTKVTRNTSTKYSLGSIQGGTIGYGTVTTLYGPTGANGKTISQFSSVADVGTMAAMQFPYPPTDQREYRRGLLLYQADYNATQKVKSVSNNYTFNPLATVINFAAGFLTTFYSGYCQDAYPDCGISSPAFTITSEQVKHNSATQTVYNTLGPDSVTTTTNYYYDDAANMQPIRTVSVNSKGDTVLNYNRTALEEAAINSSIPLSAAAITAIDTMLNRNMVGVPVESEKYVKGVLTSKMLINYQLINNMVLPQEIKSQAGSDAIQSRLLLNNYDTYGNLLEQQKTTGPLNDYIWDYASAYPIASVVNGGQPDIAYTSFESNGSGNWTIPSSARDTVAITGYYSYNLSNGAITRPGLTAATTYILSYWTKNASPFTIGGTITGYPITGANINGWTYYEHRITGQASVSISGSGDIDELRLYPLNALMTTYTYSPLTGMTTSCSAKNEISYYQYDSFMRLSNIRDQYGNVIKHYDYNYYGQ